MIDLSPAPDTQNAIIDYLAKNFPPNERRKPTVVSGNYDVKFTEWVMPTARPAHPRSDAA